MLSSEQAFTLPSYAKINLYLRILGRRETDGFHELCTVFQTISLKDEITFRADDNVVLTCSDEKIPTDDRNLIVRAAKKLRDRYGLNRGARIHLEKNIPAPGGLGGGSSNAATALIGLARLWRIKIDLSELAEIGKSLGADVPFFFCGGTALGVERGDKIFPLADLDEKNLLVATPNVSVSTAAAFARINAARLTNKRSKSILQICRRTAKTVGFRQADLTNDFEETIFRFEPEIERVKNTLLGFQGANAVSMSGSGASVFAVFDNTINLRTAFDWLQKQTDWRVFAAETVTRREFRGSLGFGTNSQTEKI